VDLTGTAKSYTRHAAVRLGVWPYLVACREARRPWLERRDEQDMRNLRLLMRFLLRSTSNCIDVGAHVGSVLQQMLEFAPYGQHVAFEPLPELVERLRVAFPTVDIREVALADMRGTAEFVRVPEALPYSGLRKRSYPGPYDTETITVNVDCLDDCLPNDYRSDFIKIDVEGGEREVIAGGIEHIAKHQPIIAFEHGKGAADCYGSGPADIYELLNGAGLEIFDIDGVGPYSVSQMEDTFDSGRLWNYVARPAR
jgi:FkbM family methyltransferase